MRIGPAAGFRPCLVCSTPRAAFEAGIGVFKKTSVSETGTALRRTGQPGCGRFSKIGSMKHILPLVLAGAACAFSADAQWKPLFDGKTMDGWTHVGPGSFSVDNGILKT